jgi:hypothetical protein
MSEIDNAAKPLTYVANDWFYMKTGANEECNNQNDPKCEENKSAVDTLRNTTNHLGASTTQYNDAKMLYNRELLFTVNILAGLAMLCYYIYLNQSVLPSPADAIKGMGELSGKMVGPAVPIK